MKTLTDTAFYYLLEISHPSLAVPIRVVNNAKPITHDQRTYLPFPFSLDAIRVEKTKTVTILTDSRFALGHLENLGTCRAELRVIEQSTPNIAEAVYSGTISCVNYIVRMHIENVVTL